MNLEGNRRWVPLKFCQSLGPSLIGGSTVVSCIQSRSFKNMIMNSIFLFLEK